MQYLKRSSPYGLTLPSNYSKNYENAYRGEEPPVGYSITNRHWLISQKYEECVERVCGRKYKDFCNDYYANSCIIIRYCRGDSSIPSNVMVSADYKDFLFKKIIYKAYQLFWGESNREDFLDEEYFEIEEHVDEQATNSLN